MNAMSVTFVTFLLINGAWSAQLTGGISTPKSVPVAKLPESVNKTVKMKSEPVGNSSDLSRFARMYKGIHTTSWTDYSFIGQLMLREKKGKEFHFYCTGFMVTRQIMVTSTHCLRDWDGGIESLRVRLETDLSKDNKGSQAGSNWRVSGVFRHPGFTDRRETVDLSLIRTDIPVTLDHKLYPIFLPEPGEAGNLIDDDFTRFYTLAMGASFDGDPGYRLKSERVKLWKDRCNLEWMIQIDPTHQLCVLTKTFRYCVGDLGSPIFTLTSRGPVIVAMVSEILYYCSKEEYQKNEAVIASHITSDMPWILAKIDRYTKDHGLNHLIDKWKNIPYPKEVNEDSRMDIEGNPDSF